MKEIVIIVFITAVFTIRAWGQGVENGHEYVDLGLPSGTLWATCNVGAEMPEAFGDYFAWGETETHYLAGGDSDSTTWKEGYSNGYDWTTYKFMIINDSTLGIFTKYTITDHIKEYKRYDSAGISKGDDKTELDDEDDVAVQKWGGKWRMPTVAMMEELLRECYWVWTTTYNGKSVKGYIAYKAKYDGDKGQLISSYFTPSPNYDVARDTHLFFPAPGKHLMTGFDTEDDSGAYWSRSLDKKISHFAFCLGLNNYVYIGSGARSHGFPVRPVCHKGDE